MIARALQVCTVALTLGALASWTPGPLTPCPSGPLAPWLSATLHAQSSYAPRLERPVLTTGAGAQRLAVDVALLAGAAPFETVRSDGRADSPRWRAHGGLADLRLFTADRREVGYLLVYPDVADPQWLNGAILPIAATESETRKTSGFEADFGAMQTVDMIRVEGLPAPLLKPLVLEGSGDREHWTLLQSEATLFDLPSERLCQVALPFRAGAYRYLRVTWDDTHSGRVPLPRAVFVRRAASGAPPPSLSTEVGFERRPSEPGRSRYRVRLPGARLPIVALSLDVGGGHVFRAVTVSESRFAGAEAIPAQIGRGTIARVTHSGATASQLRIPIAPPREPELDLVVEDGSNPPLDLRSVVAEFAEMPWIYFEAPAGPIVARYGDSRAAAPAYDLEAARASIRIMDVPIATWGAPHEATESPAPRPATPMPETGAEVDPAAFRFRRPLPEAPPGLVALTLDPAILAHSRGPSSRFADVRVVDAGGRQVPYIVERLEEPLTIDLALKPFAPRARELRSESGRQRSVYALQLPYPGLPPLRLVLETSSRVFQRNVQVGVERPPDRRRRDTWFDVKGASIWSHAEDTTAAPALTMPIDAGSESDLVIVVDEGDNRALPIAAARALLPSYRLRFYQPPGPLRVVYGRDDLTVPQYDLTLLASKVMGAEAREVAAEAADPSSSAPAVQLLSPRMFWIGLGAAVFALLAIIVRLMKSSDASL